MGQGLFGRTAIQQAVDDGAGRDPEGIGNDRRDADAGIAEDFDQPVLLHGHHGSELLQAAADLTQGAQLFRRDEAAAQQARPRQHRQPFGIAGVGLSPWHLLDVLGVDHHGPDAGLFQCRIRAFPVDAGAFHDYDVGPEAHDPFGHGAAVVLEPAEVAAVDLRLLPRLGCLVGSTCGGDVKRPKSSYRVRLNKRLKAP